MYIPKENDFNTTPISTISEKTMHYVRWLLTIGWLVLIASLFYDPISQYLTDSYHNHSFFLIEHLDNCIEMKGKCFAEKPYPIGTRVFWGMIVPSAIMVVLVFGHEIWRRICPLYFLSQIPRALGIKPKLKIQKNEWLVKNHLYVQFSLLFIGLNFRILFINSERYLLGIFLLFTIFSAITTVYLYGGRTWCHYICPFGVVQMVLTGPRGLLASKAHLQKKGTISPSTCRIIDKETGKEKNACVNCKSNCVDIDSEKSYWENLVKPGRKLVQYGYLGLVIGYFIYYVIYSGGFEYYFSGYWTHEDNQLGTILGSGFYLFNQSIPIPKLISVPLTLGFSIFFSCLICTKLEKKYKVFLRRKQPNITQEKVLHRMFCLCTWLAFNLFYIYGGRPEIIRFSLTTQLIIQSLVIFVSTIWLCRNWDNSYEKYCNETMADKIIKQLQKSPIEFTELSQNNSSDQQFTPDEIGKLGKVLLNTTKQYRFKIFKGIIHEVIKEKDVKIFSDLEIVERMAYELNLTQSELDILYKELAKDLEIESEFSLNLLYKKIPYKPESISSEVL